jgi:(E)-4-hydroxy-3-methyl-but-2-enyl pyrophosphate reductase
LKEIKPRIIKAHNIGFCFGVKRAVRAAEDFLLKNERAYSIGPIIHNPYMVEELSSKGLKVISDIKQAKGKCLVIRSHGMPPALREKAQEFCSEIIDATCPFVDCSHKIVTKLRKEGYRIAIVGEREHPEIQALVEMAGADCIVIAKESDIRHLRKNVKKLAVVAQTTLSRDKFIGISRALLKTDYFECRIFDTICNDVFQRQKEAKSIAKRAEIVFVVGGKNSANTRHLAQICRRSGACTYHIETAGELRPEWIKGDRSIGIVSGASTPGNIVEDVFKKIKKYNSIRRNKQNAGKQH